MDRFDVYPSGDAGRPPENSGRRATLLNMAVALVVLSQFLAGCAVRSTTYRPTSDAADGCGRCTPHVEIIRGLGGYMPGSDDWQARLAACGVASTVSCGMQSAAIVERILARRRAGNCCPIVLMAYATGGKGTMTVADALAEHGICVDAVILLEPSFFEPVRSNVRYCFVAYKPEPLQQWNAIMRGLPVKVESSATQVTLVNLETIDPNNRLDEYNHLNITTDPWVQQLLVGQAVGVFRH